MECRWHFASPISGRLLLPVRSFKPNSIWPSAKVIVAKGQKFSSNFANVTMRAGSRDVFTSDPIDGPWSADKTARQGSEK